MEQGIEFFVETGFIANKTPRDVAQFLLETDGLSKAMIGEYLGEGSVYSLALPSLPVRLMLL